MNNIVVREANMEDAELLLSWRNDPLSLSASGEANQQNINSHIEWLKKALKNRDFSILIAELNGNPIGVVRLELEHGCNVLSWTIAPDERGRGFGKKIVKNVVKELSGPTCALIRKNNAASIKIAYSIGLECVASNGDLMMFTNLPDSEEIKLWIQEKKK